MPKASPRTLLAGKGCPDADSFYRLRGLGLIAGSSTQDCQFRCRIYETYLKTHLV